MPEKIIVIGAGQAAAQAIDTLRRRGFIGSLIVVGDEPLLPYQRPPLSKKYLSGALPPERLLLRPPSFYAERHVEARLGRRAVRLERGKHQVVLDDGAELEYEALLLCTGSRPRELKIPGAARAGVYTLRTAADADRLRAEFSPGRHLVVVGGGYIGLEVAATAREMGLDVTVLEMANRVMNRVVCSPISAFYAAEHVRHGVRIVCNARVSAFTGDEGTEDGRVRAVQCEDGMEYPADIVLVGVGVVPAAELAAQAGLACGDGIVVNEHCRTSDPAIYAAGDCTEHPSLRYGRRLRLESVDNAFEQGTSAALNMLGLDTVHDKLPWFWSDQYDLKLVIIGICRDHDEMVLRGDPATRAFSACYLRAGELVAVDTVNSPKDQMAARKLIAARVRPNRRKLADAGIPLSECI